MFKRIVVGTDGSSCAGKALHVAGDLAKRYGAKLTVLHVYAPPATALAIGDAAGAGLDPVLVEPWADDTQHSVEDQAVAIMKECAPAYEFCQEYGYPAERIAACAEERKADLIIVGSRGLSGIRSLFLGSVSDRVTHLAHCPVLIVK